MTTLRFLLILLLLLNALAFGAIKGWFGFAPPQGEPERVTNQLYPERIKLLNAPVSVTAAEPSPPSAEKAPAPEAVSAPAPTEVERTPVEMFCLAWTGLDSNEAQQVGSRLADANLKPVQRRVEKPSSWWVRIPPLPNRDAADRKARELRAQGVTDLFIVQEAGPNQFAISLGLFKTESSSNQHLAEMKAKGVRGASIAVRTTAEYVVEVRAEQSALDAVIAADPFPRNRSECQK